MHRLAAPPLRGAVSKRFLLVATLIAFCTCVSAGAEPATPAPKIDPAQLKPFETILDATLVAFNEANSTQFSAHFGRNAIPPLQPTLFAALFEGVYKREYGKYISKKLLPKETTIEPARALIVFESVFEKRKVKVSANFVNEQNTPKIVQLRMEPL
ncbi:MAG TPA: hypothetical protein VFV83_02705 [Chthoniobacteraceae bacterium]|nr:hypothetical protein [Chthoniobacteraceae bacterium]